jgi:hypothetical protein
MELAGREGTLDGKWISDHDGWCDKSPATFECTPPFAPSPTYLTEQDAMGGMDPLLAAMPCVAPRRNASRQQLKHQQQHHFGLAFEQTHEQRKQHRHRRQRWLHDTPADPCAVLKGANVKHILFVGDSYVRMAYQAMGMWLSNNYRDASVSATASAKVAEKICKACPPAAACNHLVLLPELCDFDGQFRDNDCRPYILEEMEVCSGKVTLHNRQSYFPAAKPTTPDFERYDIIVWGLGAHPPDNSNYTTHYGANTAKPYNDAVLEPTCKCKPFESAIPDQVFAQKVIFEMQRWGNHDCVGPCKQHNRLDENSPFTCEKKSTVDGTTKKSMEPCWDAIKDCKPWTSTMANKVIWLHPHFRPRDGRYPQEFRNVTDLFAEEMPAFLKSTCGVKYIVNPYGMTKALVKRTVAVMEMAGFANELKTMSQYDKTSLYCHSDLGKEPMNMCWGLHSDPSHWGMAVNLVKAHNILGAIQAMVDDRGSNE